MSRLILVRHGQARAFEQDSDRLTERGMEQALRLGQYFAARGMRFDEVYSGTLERQKRTLLLISNAYRDARLPWPTIRLIPGWNEYDSAGVLRHLQPALAARDPAFAQLVHAAAAHRQTPDANRHFQPMFETLLNRWIAGGLEHPDVETWTSFRARVETALRRILNAEGPSRNVLVVTSGGPIATAVQTVLEAPPRMALELNWRMRNASITEFLFTKGRVTLDLFNAAPHLEQDFVTYR
ncbi:MAG: histidine phosphatase family protein [Bryobacterales bacterium]|nr:histidine phosphatase family protein [Bryobacterales bacterium]